MDIKIKVIPKSSINSIIGFENEILKIKLTTVPEKGFANKALIDLLSKSLKIPKSSILILKGKTSSSKIVRLEGVSIDELTDILNRPK